MRAGLLSLLTVAIGLGCSPPYHRFQDNVLVAAEATYSLSSGAATRNPLTDALDQGLASPREMTIVHWHVVQLEAGPDVPGIGDVTDPFLRIEIELVDGESPIGSGPFSTGEVAVPSGRIGGAFGAICAGSECNGDDVTLGALTGTASVEPGSVSVGLRETEEAAFLGWLRVAGDGAHLAVQIDEMIDYIL